MAGARQYDNHDETRLLLALSLVPGMGNKGIHQFLAVLKGYGFSLRNIESVPARELKRKVPEMTTRFAGVLEKVTGETREEADACIRRALEADIDMVTILDRTYPAALAECLESVSPPVLFLLGDRTLLEGDACAVVGTRSPSRSGLRAANRAAESIVGAGMAMASGGAAGVDHTAHEAAVKAGGMTILFLPQGILTYALPGTWKTAIAKGRLLMVSEYLPDAPWRTYAAVSRNALIAAQSRLVCVVEPGKQGGSILTARHALAQGKPVLVEPVQALPASLQPQVSALDSLNVSLAALKEGISKGAPRQSHLF